MGQFGIDKLYATIVTTQTGGVPCAGVDGELGKYALLSDVESNCKKLQERIETINTTGAFTPVMTTASISAKFVNDLENHKKEFIQTVSAIVEAEINDVNVKTEKTIRIIDDSIQNCNDNLDKCNNEIKNIYVRLNSQEELNNGNFEANQKINDILTQYIAKVEKELLITKEEVVNNKSEIKTTNETLKKENDELKQIISEMKTQIVILENQNKEIMKALLSINKKLRVV